jgi:hypothetical protein
MNIQRILYENGECLYELGQVIGGHIVDKILDNSFSDDVGHHHYVFDIYSGTIKIASLINIPVEINYTQ